MRSSTLAGYSPERVQVPVTEFLHLSIFPTDTALSTTPTSPRWSQRLGTASVSRTRSR